MFMYRITFKNDDVRYLRAFCADSVRIALGGPVAMVENVARIEVAAFSNTPILEDASGAWAFWVDEADIDSSLRRSINSIDG